MQVGVDPYAEIYKQMLRERKLDEAASKKRRKRKSAQLRQVSFAPKFQEDVKKYEHDDDVKILISEIMEHLKNRKDDNLVDNHDDHALRRNLTGCRSLKLYPGEREKDILIPYKLRSGGNHSHFLKIGNHKYVYYGITESLDLVIRLAELKSQEIEELGSRIWRNRNVD